VPKFISPIEIVARLEERGFGCHNPTKMGTRSPIICKCGKVFIARPTDLVSKLPKTTSCGCLRGRGRRRGTDDIPGEYFGCVKQHARARNLEFKITIDYIDQLLKDQCYQCKLSGVPIHLEYSGIKNASNTASLDRIDNTQGYLIGNVQWLHKDVNWMKQDFNERHFLAMCRWIAEHTANETQPERSN
jgi:hypothetical protein